MYKVCVFCGKKPAGKSNEHIIPQWLIELTGNPKRIAYFGHEDLLEPESKEREFSFDAFKFPSCASCNAKFSRLESIAKVIVSKIESEAALSMEDLSVLLDWFDKIRVGLWLGYRYLGKNPVGITPNFYIEDRIGLKDRLLFICKSKENKIGLNFWGCDLPSFLFTPSCFLLRINKFWFLNMSFEFLISRRIGFPFPAYILVSEDEKLEAEISKGRNYVMTPLLKKAFSLSGTELYQPMFAGHLDYESTEYYDTKYVRENSLNFEKGIGKVFISDTQVIKEYPSASSKDWIPKAVYSFRHLYVEMQILTLEWQNYINDLTLSRESKDKKDKRKRTAYKNKYLRLKAINDALIRNRRTFFKSIYQHVK